MLLTAENQILCFTLSCASPHVPEIGSVLARLKCFLLLLWLWLNLYIALACQPTGYPIPSYIVTLDVWNQHASWHVQPIQSWEIVMTFVVQKWPQKGSLFPGSARPKTPLGHACLGTQGMSGVTYKCLTSWDIKSAWWWHFLLRREDEDHVNFLFWPWWKQTLSHLL